MFTFLFLSFHPRSLRFLAKNSLMITNVGRRDRGVYQCLVENQKSSAQAMAELKLGGKCLMEFFRLVEFCNSPVKLLQDVVLCMFVAL